MEYLRKNKPNNEANSPLCKTCGGKCCKNMAGSTRPEDFNEPLLESLITAFKTGKWVIDWWEAEYIFDDDDDDFFGVEKMPRIYYVRPAHDVSCGDSGLHDGSWGGTCVFLEETGCSIPADMRPAECRSLHPVDTDTCKCEHSKEENKDAWLPYQYVIHKACKIVEGEMY